MREKLLHQIVRRLETDYAPFGKTDPDGPDCSSGCRHFVKLAQDSGEHWGVCVNPESHRAGLLTFERQGCAAFESITANRNLTDSQLRSLISDANQILHGRRRQDAETPTGGGSVEVGDFVYRVRTSYFPRVKNHFPTIFRLEWRGEGWLALPLEARVCGDERPTVIATSNATNGDVFKIVRLSGEFSYQVPFNGEIYNLKQFGDLSEIGISQTSPLCRFLEHVEAKVFDRIVNDARSQIQRADLSLEEGRARLERWRRQEFSDNEKARNKAELRKMIAAGGPEARETQVRLTRYEAFLDLLDRIDRSNLLLETVACPPAPDSRASKTRPR